MRGTKHILSALGLTLVAGATITASCGKNEDKGGDAVCDAYLGCVAVVDPGAYPGEEAAFKAGGDCWKNNPADACVMACQTSLADLAMQHPDEPACQETGDGDGDGEAGEAGESGEPAPSCMGSVDGPFAWNATGVNLTNGANAPQFAVTGDGAAMILFEDFSMNPPALGGGYFGGAWAAATLPPGLPGTEQMRLAGTADGNFVALWLDGGWKAATSMGNDSWGGAADVGAGGSAPSLDASDFGDAIAVWHQGGGVRGNLGAADGSWGSAANLGDGVDDEAALATAMSRNGNWAVAAWNAGANVGAVVAESGSFGSPTMLSSGGEAVWDVEVATDCSGASYVVWAQGDADEGFQDGAIGIYSARHNGSEWGGPEQIGADVPFGGGAGQEKVDPASGFGVSGHAAVVWVDRGAQSVMAATRDPDSGWQDAVMIGDVRDSGERAITVGVDRDGNATAVWNYGNGRLQLSQFDGSGWSAPATFIMGGVEDLMRIEYADDGQAFMMVGIAGSLQVFRLE